VLTPSADCGKLEVKVEGPDDECVPNVKPTGDGNYDVDYTPKKPGSYLIHVTLDGEEIPKSPFAVTVDDSLASKTTADGPLLHGGIAGEPGAFKVTAPEPKPGALEVKAGLMGETRVDWAEGADAPKVKENADGTFDVDYTPKAPGTYMIAVTLDEIPITGSAWVVNVKAPSRAGDVECVGKGLEHATVPLPAEFKVLTPSADCGKLEVKVEGPDDECVPNVKPTGDGNYDVDYTPKKPGSYLIHVTLDGEPVPKSPFAVAVKENLAHRCTAAGQGIEDGMATVPGDFVVTGPRANIGKLEVKIEGPRTDGEAEIKEKGDGTWCVT